MAAQSNAATAGTATVQGLLSELAALEDPQVRAVNERHGDDHGVNLGQLRAIAKRVKPQPALARELWATGDTAARLLSVLISRPKAFTAGELDAMVRQGPVPKVNDWLVNYVVKKSPHAQVLRPAWLADPDPVVAASGWALTSERVVKSPDGLDVDHLLAEIAEHMATAPQRLQWAMNHCLAQIGIELPEHRAQALDIGARLGVLKDHPTPPNCTSPYAPLWIKEILRRREAG
ncbi:DNA alkylation repair protein [Specibacter sp. NPDC057265]|uniref:DNA alkylation repair protein n=1 Tax=Specibacter sp. NPDC057265 TaxID=3346075 RepID=UPI003636A634